MTVPRVQHGESHGYYVLCLRATEARERARDAQSAGLMIEARAAEQMATDCRVRALQTLGWDL